MAFLEYWFGMKQRFHVHCSSKKKKFNQTNDLYCHSIYENALTYLYNKNLKNFIYVFVLEAGFSKKSLHAP